MSKDFNTLVLPELRQALESHNVEELRSFCSALHPAATSETLGSLDAVEIWTILLEVDATLRAEIFSYFDEDLQVQIIESCPREEIAKLIEEMPSDDRVDVLEEVEQDAVDEILPLLSTEEREDVELLRS
ncbi:MAG: magnesium transporter, partial [Thermoguttaceae bacterium]|nr:magnesium transporter [Thermoguttaceae bacterium]